MHRCYACDDRNPDRLCFDEGGRLRVPARFRGPPGGVNGGVAVGMLACPIMHHSQRGGVEHAAVSRITARIRAGVSVERDLAVTVRQSGGHFSGALQEGEDELLSATSEVVWFDDAARPGDAIGNPPPDRAADVAELAALPVPEAPPFYVDTGEHPIPGCFSCGPENPQGLYVYPRVVRDGVTCAAWPDASAFDNAERRGDGSLSLAVLTSAIDCSSGVCLPVAQQRELLELDQFFLLGSIDVRYLRVPPVTIPYRVAAKHLGREGRKFYGMSVLADEDGVAYAMAETTWIIAAISRTEAFGGVS
ncbi:MAG: hypothetical protein HY873_10060 [Chloroflexi bacterium]|nr:hypothetical protein [Chloroflexota bacterium]